MVLTIKGTIILQKTLVSNKFPTVYRGYSDDFRQWIYGSYFEYVKIMPPATGISKSENVDHCIIRNGFADWNLPTKPQLITVDPNSVGLFTGLLTNDGKHEKLFSDDIVEVSDTETGETMYRGVIEYFLRDGYPAFDIDQKYIPTDFDYDFNVLSEILAKGYEMITRIGTVYDSPDLMANLENKVNK